MFSTFWLAAALDAAVPTEVLRASCTNRISEQGTSFMFIGTESKESASEPETNGSRLKTLNTSN